MTTLVRRRAKTAGVLVSSTLASAAVLATTPLGVAPAGALPPSSCVAHSAFTDVSTNGYYAESGTHNKVGKSGCPSIYASADTCRLTRVRFFPSSGGDYPTGWTEVCGGLGTYVVASNVIAGTKYRSESPGSAGPSFFGVWD